MCVISFLQIGLQINYIMKLFHFAPKLAQSGPFEVSWNHPDGKSMPFLYWIHNELVPIQHDLRICYIFHSVNTHYCLLGKARFLQKKLKCPDGVMKQMSNAVTYLRNTRGFVLSFETQISTIESRRLEKFDFELWHFFSDLFAKLKKKLFSDMFSQNIAPY